MWDGPCVPLALTALVLSLCAAGFAGHITKDPFLFWFLVVGMNSPWAVFPVILWRQSFKALCSGMAGCVHLIHDFKDCFRETYP